MGPQAQGGVLASGNWFLKTPNVFKLRYRTGTKNHPFLNKFKQCFLTDVQTTYTGEGVYSTYDDGTPVSMILDLSFKELQPIYDIDYDEYADQHGGSRILMGYFRELPNLRYPSFLSDKMSSLDYVEVKNIFRRAKLRDDLQNNFTVFDKYEIPMGARPDTVAEDLYGNAEFDWVVLTVAGIINVRNEWPLIIGIYTTIHLNFMVIT